ncbi:MAG: DUF1003 domain-containing protein [Streptococcus sp.]
MAIWMLINVLHPLAGILTPSFHLAQSSISTIVAIQAPLIMMSQNRQIMIVDLTSIWSWKEIRLLHED